MPLLLLRVAKITPPISRSMAMAVVSVGIYLGQFLSPLILKAASKLGRDPFRAQFNSLAAALALAALIGIGLAVKNKQGGKSSEASSAEHSNFSHS